MLIRLKDGWKIWVVQCTSAGRADTDFGMLRYAAFSWPSADERRDSYMKLS